MKDGHHQQSASPFPPWHAETLEHITEKLTSSLEGLSEPQARERLNRDGPNKLPEAKRRSPLVRFLYQFHNILVYVLLIACVTTAILGHWLDAGVILGVVLINAAIGFIQEGKAEDALKAIRQMLSPNALIIRGNRQMTIPAEELVCGDVVLLQSGDKVPADLRLFKVKSFQINEAVLTGESVAVEKNTASVESDTILGDRFCMAFSGTLVTHGQACGIVVATGSDTEIGRISTLVSEVEHETTPLLIQMTRFARWLTAWILAIALATFVIGVFLRDFSATQMFLAAVSIAVAAIPEGLPAIMTITLAIGVQRMARRNAIIRRLPAVETLGSVSVICTDKTGTITRNEMTARSIVTANTLYTLTGTGYDPHGVVMVGEQTVQADEQPLLTEMIRAAVLCNDASLEQNSHAWCVHGDPMEGALLVAGLKTGQEQDTETKLYPRDDLIPFESEHRFMATLHHSHNHDHSKDSFIFVKGAPERVLEMCEQQKTNSSLEQVDHQFWQQHIEQLASQGQRVLAVAYKPARKGQKELRFVDVEEDFIMLGLFGLIDPPREEAIRAVSKCKQAGIRVKMITGDHAMTAKAIAQRLKLLNPDNVLTGQQLQHLTDKQLQNEVDNVDVYARVSPEHKVRLINALKQKRAIVAMTGDGVNDAPALRRCDVGTAMGKNGTEAAKEASEMVLADDNFASIAYAVEEGRTVYDNLKKAILFILPTSGGVSLCIIAAVAYGFHQLPLTPVQILWINMITTVTLALSLGFEPPESEVMKRPPRDADEPMLDTLLTWRIIFVSFVLMCGTLGIFLWETGNGQSVDYARTAAVNTLVMFEIFYLFNSRYITGSVFSWEGFTGNRFILLAIAVLIVFQLGFTYLLPFQLLFSTTAIDANTWFNITLIASSVLFLVELEKYLVRRFHPNRTKPTDNI
ncbi:cation-transporting P-type ATPase [uncultured Photobacterium sp.]|uniref:cation-transporting P-type ATPase n=1 Tax=uncultured Photobacterium sp. TaxID=173973 RepID=UPI0026140ABA|nr:cation-transporting P-type ATPase [uncultured Photobacterium sp.]